MVPVGQVFTFTCWIWAGFKVCTAKLTFRVNKYVIDESQRGETIFTFRPKQSKTKPNKIFCSRDIGADQDQLASADLSATVDIMVPSIYLRS